MFDGCMDAYAADVIACGAIGITSEPYTDYKSLARRCPDCFLLGEGDNRVLSRSAPAEIRAMFVSIADTGRMSRGYTMCIGNHIPWGILSAPMKRSLEFSNQLNFRSE